VHWRSYVLRPAAATRTANALQNLHARLGGPRASWFFLHVKRTYVLRAISLVEQINVVPLEQFGGPNGVGLRRILVFDRVLALKDHIRWQDKLCFEGLMVPN
jgi:hypothetical protein